MVLCYFLEALKKSLKNFSALTFLFQRKKRNQCEVDRYLWIFGKKKSIGEKTTQFLIAE
jgi:hypothetical protein